MPEKEIGCVDRTITAKPKCRRLVTLNCDVEKQHRPPILIEARTVTSSGPVKTATKDNNWVRKFKSFLRFEFGEETPLVKREDSEKILSPKEKEGGSDLTKGRKLTTKISL